MSLIEPFEPNPLDHRVNVERHGFVGVKAPTRPPAFLRRLIVGIPCVIMNEPPLPIGRRATATEIRARQVTMWESAVVLHGTFLSPGGDA